MITASRTTSGALYEFLFRNPQNSQNRIDPKCQTESVFPPGFKNVEVEGVFEYQAAIRYY